MRVATIDLRIPPPALRTCEAPGIFPFDPYPACAFGCVSCPAPPWTRDAEAEAAGARDRLREAAFGRRGKVTTLLLGEGADPYPPVERRLEATRSCLEELVHCGGAGVRVVTRSDLVVRDADLLAALGAAVTVVIPTRSAGLCLRLEPGAPEPRRRLDALRGLRRSGVACGVRIEPVLPGISDRLSGLRGLLSDAASAGAGWADARGLRLPGRARGAFRRFLSELRPALARRYLDRFGPGEDPPVLWERRLRAVVASLSLETGLRPEAHPGPSPDGRSLQLRLPFRGAGAESGYAVGPADGGRRRAAVAG
jgi:DNA repair photolyase